MSGNNITIYPRGIGGMRYTKNKRHINKLHHHSKKTSKGRLHSTKNKRNNKKTRSKSRA